MKWYPFIVIALSVFIPSVYSAEELIVRSEVLPADALVGQRVILRVEVLGKDSWAQITRFDNFDVPGAYVMRTQSQGIRLQEKIQGSDYTGQRYELSLFPQRGGRIEIPPIGVEVSSKSWGANATEVTEAIEVPGLILGVSYPPGAEGLQGVISTTELRATQSWNPDTTAIKVGDAIQRSFVFEANDVSGMAFLPISHPEMEGISLYPKEPIVEDRTERGTIKGKRTEVVSFVFESPGDFQLPPVDLYWWDLQAKVLRHVELPGQMVQVEPDPTAITVNAEDDFAAGSSVRWVYLALVMLIAALGYFFRRTAFGAWNEWRTRRMNSESWQFREVMRVARSGNDKAVIREVMLWLDRIGEGPLPARLDQFLEKYGTAETITLGSRMGSMKENALSASEVSSFTKGLVLARKRWKNSSGEKARQQSASDQLPELN